MPARDHHHEAVKNARQKDGWLITHDPRYSPVKHLDIKLFMIMVSGSSYLMWLRRRSFNGYLESNRPFYT